MAEVLDFKGLNTLDKIEHKNWKARVEGYEEALKAMQMSDSGKDPLFNPYLGLVKNMVIDSNAVAQEKALEVILLFVQEANVANKAANDICPGIVNKCFNSTRQKTRDLAFEILKVIVEIERQDVVMEELVKGLNSKNPKVVSGTTIFLKETLNDFGPKIVPMKEMFKTVHKLLEDRDKNVREAGKELIIEMYRWIGSTALNPVLSQIKPVQVTELNAEFEKLPREKPVPSRYLKSQKPKESAQVKPTGGGDAVSQQSVGKQPQNNVEIDPYDLVDPVEVISKIPANFYGQIEEKKWTDRKDALEIIEKLTNNPKLIPGDYGDLMKSLLKVLSKDTNIVLVALSAKVIYQIATGLRKKFSPYAVNTIRICLEKFKEKKLNVVAVIRDCIDASFDAININLCIDDLINASNHKNPNIRTETVLFLNRIFEKINLESWSGKLLNQLIPNLTTLCQDSIFEVRDAAFKTLGTAMKVLTEKKLKPYLDNVANLKLVRINEFFEKSKLEPQLMTPISQIQSKVCQSDNLQTNSIKAKINLPCKKRKEIEPIENILNHNVKSPIKEQNSIIDLNESQDLSINQDCESSCISLSDSHTIENLKQTESVDLEIISENLEADNNQSFKLQAKSTNYFDPKTSVFYEMMRKSKNPTKEDIETFFWLFEHDKKTEQLNQNKMILMKDHIKLLINNIISKDPTTSIYASDKMIGIISESPSIIKDYKLFILAVFCKQILLIISEFESTIIDLTNYGTCLKKLLFMLKEIVQLETAFDNLDDEFTIVIMAVLLKLSDFLNFISMNGLDEINIWLSTLAVAIYQRTVDRPFTNVMKIVAIKIKSPAIDIDLFCDFDIIGIIDKLYNKYIQIPV